VIGLTTIEDKIRLFSKIIYDKIKEEKQVEFDNFEREREVKLEKLKRELNEKRLEELKEASKKAKIKAVEKVSKEKVKFQQRELALREDMMRQINEVMKEKISRYIETVDYEDLLLKLVKDAIDNLEKNNCTLYLTKGDVDRVSEKIKSYSNSKNVSMVIKEEESGILGGFLMEDSERKYRIDNSLRNKLIHLKDYIGLSINESLR
jgi:V/A-type H+-transporting ATPase subunit E